ncbi:MAG: DUF1440 domain-containing protein [Herpetosiphonaceae bacterium]|nr:DUF1440 domain-containing protein [Herpetosiphonaceae bacterium]
MRMPRPLVGATAGFLATIPMTAVMTALYPLLPRGQHYSLPPSQITGKATQAMGLQLHIDQNDHRLLTALTHFGFGSMTGTLYTPLARRLPAPPAITGMAYGLLVWLTSYMGWLPALGVLPHAAREPRGRNALMIVAHLVWGLSLGLLTERLDADTK